MIARRVPGRLLRLGARAATTPVLGAGVRRASTGLLDLTTLRQARLPAELAPLTPDEPSGALPTHPPEPPPAPGAAT